MIRATLMFAILLGGCERTSQSPQPTIESTGVTSRVDSDTTGPVNTSVAIVFSKPSYTFSAAAAARGIEIAYEIVVRDDVANVLPLSQHSQSNIRIDLNGPSPAKGCVLEPFARLSGSGQFYGEFSPGCLDMQTTISPAMLRQGRYSHAFKWNGRNLSSDGGGGSLPYGAPFPPGDYVLNVRCTGSVVTNGVTTHFEVTGNVRLTISD